MNANSMLLDNLQEYIQDLEDAATDFGATVGTHQDDENYGCTEMEFNRVADKLSAARSRLERLIEFMVLERT